MVTQTQPLVPRDEVTTKQRLDGAFAENLPVDRLNQSWRCSPASSLPSSTTRRQLFHPRRPHRRERRPTSTACRYSGLPRATTGQGSTAAPRSATRHQRLRRGIGDHRVVLGRVRQRAVRDRLDRRPGPAATSSPGTCRYETDELFGRVQRRRASTGSRAAFGGPLASRSDVLRLRRAGGQKSVDAGFDSRGLPDLRAGRASTPCRGAQRAG